MNEILTNEEKKDLRQIYVRSGMIFGAFNMIKMEGQGFGYAMNGVINRLYANDEENRKEALLRHTEFFNTHAATAGFIFGLVYAMEKQRSTTLELDSETISSIKVALMGPLAGIGDSLFYNTIRVIAASIAIGFAMQGSALGFIIFILIYGGSFLIIKGVLLNYGYTLGNEFMQNALKSGVLDMITRSAAIVGMMMVGAIVSTNVNVPLALKFEIGGSEIKFAQILDSIMPGILSLGLLYVVVTLLKRKVSPTKLVLGMMLISIILAVLHVF